MLTENYSTAIFHFCQTFSQKNFARAAIYCPLCFIIGAVVETSDELITAND